jgi:hypothetical protein
MFSVRVIRWVMVRVIRLVRPCISLPCLVLVCLFLS